jgi:hypothetical protein
MSGDLSQAERALIAAIREAHGVEDSLARSHRESFAVRFKSIAGHWGLTLAVTDGDETEGWDHICVLPDDHVVNA